MAKRTTNNPGPAPEMPPYQPGMNQNLPGMGWHGGGNQQTPNLPGMDWMGGGQTGGVSGGLGGWDWGENPQTVPTMPPEFSPPNTFTGPYTPPSSIGQSGAAPYTPPSGGTFGGGGPGFDVNFGGRGHSIIGGGGGGFPYDPLMGWRGRGGTNAMGPLGPVFRPQPNVGGAYPGSNYPGVSTNTPVLPPWSPGTSYNWPTAPGMYPTLFSQNNMNRAAFGNPLTPQQEWEQIKSGQSPAVPMPHQTPGGQIPGRQPMGHQTPTGQIPGRDLWRQGRF